MNAVGGVIRLLFWFYFAAAAVKLSWVLTLMKQSYAVLFWRLQSPGLIAFACVIRAPFELWQTVLNLCLISLPLLFFTSPALLHSLFWGLIYLQHSSSPLSSLPVLFLSLLSWLYKDAISMCLVTKMLKNHWATLASWAKEPFEFVDEAVSCPATATGDNCSSTFKSYLRARQLSDANNDNPYTKCAHTK